MADSRTFLQRLLICLNFTLDAEDLLCWYKWFLWSVTAAKAAENYGDEWGLIWYLRWGIYTSISTYTHSQNLVPAAEVPSLKISSQHWNICQMTTKTAPISTRIVISYKMKRYSHFQFEGKSMKTEAWRPAPLFKRDSRTGVFQWILRKF